MKTININQKVLENISKCIPEVNQDNNEIDLKVSFYGFSEVFYIVQSLLKASEIIMIDNDEHNNETRNISLNLVTIANKLLTLNSFSFIDELLLSSAYSKQTEIPQNK